MHQQHLWSLLALLGTVASDALPYNPTTILTAPNLTYAYIFQPSTQSPGQSQLLSFDLREPLTISQQSFVTVSETLPFLHSNELLPYLPVIDQSGDVTAITGVCSTGANSTEIWRFAPTMGSAVGNGTWLQSQTSLQGVGGEGSLTGSNFLANGIAFSEYVNGNSSSMSIFTFGGMCPLANSTENLWTSAASYSNQMILLAPDLARVGSDDYNISLATSRGPPIAEAGFSITGLQPSVSESSSGAAQAQTQQQNFVLLGGHTQSAFINMSQVALYSLPQESWTFLPVDQLSGAKTDLATRQIQAEVEPRSGHTAVLSQDGKSIIVFGGWVGDVNTPATPQLAILELGSGYGGNGDWSWSIPTQSGTGLAAGAGIYGHGATMLPGGIMMIIGGYAIPPPSSKRIRRSIQTASSQLYLYNTTSNSWIATYTPPASLSQQAQEKSEGSLSQKSQQAGLGAGLGIGAAILVSLVVFYYCYTRRLKRARRDRERALLSFSSDDVSAGHAHQPFLERGGIDGHGGDAATLGRSWNVWDHGEQSGQPWVPQMEQQVGTGGSTGLFINVPSPTRGLRKGLASRNFQYHPAPTYDDKRMSRGSGNIHPIAEQEEDDDAERSDVAEDIMLSDAERKLREVERVLNSPDPFLEAEPNPLGSHPVSPDMDVADTVRRVPTGASQVAVAAKRLASIDQDVVANWIAVAGPSESPVKEYSGRISPSKSDDRTSSTLSERSQRSAASSNSITRTMSTRTGAMLAAAMAARNIRDSLEHSPTEERTHTMSTHGGRKSPFHPSIRARSSTNGSAQAGAPQSASTDADSFTTVRTNFAQLQSEGEALLGGRPLVDRDDPYQRALAAHSSTQAQNTPSWHDSAPLSSLPSRRPQGWMGSLRRALNAVSIGERSSSMTGAGDQYSDRERSSSTSPTKGRRGQSSTVPRRAVSDGGALLRQKRGQKDWEDNHWPPYRDYPDPGDWGEPQTEVDPKQAEKDWDVEGAAMKRDIQVMFSVPKARLRVVNADTDRASLRSASDGALSRTESLKSSRRDESIKGPRVRSDGDNSLLASTAEKQDESRDVVKSEDALSLLEKEKAA